MTTIRLPDGVHLIVSTVLADILDAAGIAPGPDVVGRVRDLVRSREASDMGAADTLRRLDAVTLDRDNLVGKLDAMRESRGRYADAVTECGALLDKAGVPMDGLVRRVATLIGERNDHRAKVKALDEERDDLARRLEQAEDERDALRVELKRAIDSESRWEATIRQLRDERDGAREDLHKHGGAAMSTLAEMVREVCEDLAHVKADALRPKPTGPVVVAPCPWTWDTYTLRANGKLYGSIGMDPATGMWTARVCLGNARVVSDERTARALLVAVAGYDPGVTFILTLRPEWTREDIDAARNHDLGSFVAGLLEGYAEDFDGQQHDPDPRIARRWWAGGYKALNLSVKDLDDDCPF